MGIITTGPALADPTVVGHKFARQRVLQDAGLNVPEFFCVPPASPAELPAYPGPDQAASWADAAKDAVRQAGMPERLAGQILAAFDDLVGADGLVAVRACVVAAADGSGEDGASDPFAGLSDSYLYVGRDDLLGRIVGCWASAYNAEAVLYRIHRGADPVSAKVAVGVQRMVPGVRSFVAFTRDPVTGADRRVIAAVHGIGEGVVQEKADVDHFFVSGETGEMTLETSLKTAMVGLDPQRPAAGPVVLLVPDELAEPPVLTEPEVRQVCAQAAQVETLLGGGQDIEGTITDDGVIHLVQARPVVVAESTGEPDAAIPWTNHNLTESFPGLTSALTYSQAQWFYQMCFGDFYRRMGVPARVRRRNRHHLERMIGRLRGRIYYRLDAWFTLHGQLPGFDLMRPLWERSLGLTDISAPPTSRRSWLRLAKAVPRLFAIGLWHPFSVRRFLRWWDGRTAARSTDRPTEELIVSYRRMWAEAARWWGITIVNSYYSLACLGIVNQLLRRWTDDGEALLPGLLAGGKANRTLAALRSAIALAERVAATPRLREAILHRPEREVWQEIWAGQHGDDITQAFTRHLDQYGDRALHDLKLEALTPRQQPWMLLSTLRPYLTEGLTVADNEVDERRSRKATEQQLRQACRNPVRRAMLGVVLAALRYYIRAREDTRFCRSQLYGASRDVLWRLADELVRADLLGARDDVVHLTVEEVLGAFEGTVPGGDLREIAERRRAEQDEFEEMPDLPAHLTTPAGVPVAAGLQALSVLDEESGRPDDGLLRGLASAPGRVRGQAKVVLDPAVPPESCAGQILIARETDPGWLALMLAAKGMVVERGTLTSHTAITGRLLGIPTVVAVAGATTHIPDGALIELDGAAGTVRLLERAGGTG